MGSGEYGAVPRGLYVYEVEDYEGAGEEDESKGFVEVAEKGRIRWGKREIEDCTFREWLHYRWTYGLEIEFLHINIYWSKLEETIVHI